MATHDYVIDNSTGANVRADINSVLQAILTNNSSSSAPSTTAAYMWWADTTNGVLKIRNSSNNDWVELLQLDGTLTLEDGSVSAPALAFRDDLDTGIYSPSANTIAIATGGVERLQLSTGGFIFNDGGADIDFRIEGDTEANLFYVDAGNERVGVRTNSPSDFFEVTHSDNSAAGISITNTNNSQASAMAQLLIAGGDNSKGRLKIETNGAFHTIDEDNNGNLIIEDNGTERMRIDSSGRLLVGGTDANAVHTNADDVIIGNTSASVMGLSIVTSTSGYATLQFSDGGGNKNQGQVAYNHSNDSMIFTTAEDSRMIIDSNGDVGIGTSNPGQRLEVRQTSASHAIIACNRPNSDTFAVALGNNSSNNGVISVNNSDLLFGKDSSGTFNEYIRLDTSGRLLLGTTTEGISSADDLTIETPSSTGITIRSGTSSDGNLFFSDGTSGADEYRGYIQYGHASNILLFGTNAIERMRLDSSGNVGIGKDPAYTLDIARDAPSGGRMIKIGTNGTHHTSVVSSDSQGLIIFRARITVAANTTTDLVSGYGGNLVIITLQNNGGDDVQQTRIRTNGWSTHSELFFNNYGSNSPTVTFSVSSGVLKVNHQHTGPIHFNVTGLLVSGPQSQ